MRVSVTRKHIANGIGDGQACPVTLAFRDAGFPKALAGWDTCSLGDGRVVSLPESARKFIENWVMDNPVTPMAFSVEEPWQSEQS